MDESIIRSTDQRARCWVRQGKRVFASNALRLPQISMIGAISSKGKTFFANNQGKNTSLTFSLFMLNLIQEMDVLYTEWRKTTTILLGNASTHCAKRTKSNFEAFGLPIMYLAPYSFKMAAVEKLFSYVKSRNLNPSGSPGLLEVMLTSNNIKFHRSSIEIYVKELSKHLCKLDYSWVRAFSLTL